jgi:hypothetical protein
MSEMSLRDVRLPRVRMRRVRLPEILIPEIKAGGRRLSDVISDEPVGQVAAEVSMPDVKIRDVKMPEVKTPDFKMPDVKIPDVKLSDIKLGDIKLSDALSAISLPDVSIGDLPDASDIKAMLPRRPAPSPMPFILVGAITGILLGLWLATVAPTSSWIRMTADDLRTKFDRWRAGTADAVGDRMDEYLAPPSEMGSTPTRSSRIDTAAFSGTSPDQSPESSSSS